MGAVYRALFDPIWLHGREGRATVMGRTENSVHIMYAVCMVMSYEQMLTSYTANSRDVKVWTSSNHNCPYE